MKFILPLALQLAITIAATNAMGQQCANFPELKPDPDEKNVLGLRVASRFLSVLGFTIDKNSFKDVIQALGPATIYRREPGSESCSEELCYVSADHDSGVIFYRYTAWDFYGFSITSNLQELNEPHCYETKKINLANLRVSEFHLGEDKSTIIKAMGTPSEINDNIATYSYANLFKLDEALSEIPVGEKVNCNDYYGNEGSSVTFEFNENNKLKKMSVSLMGTT